MSLAVVYSRALAGVDAPEVTVEVHLANGLPGLSIVGLPEAEVKEAKDRVRAALLNARFEFPARRITINLAPADLPKEGGRFDLPIAIGILAASGQIPRESLARYEFIGELALAGQLRPVRGGLIAALKARACERALVVPMENADEAALAAGAQIIGASDLLAVSGHFNGVARLPLHCAASARPNDARQPDLAEVRGQQQAKRVLEIAAAGGHNLLLIGPPGTGKTMLATRLPGILPSMTEEEALEAASIQSLVAAASPLQHWGQRPFRAPHHTASAVALVGGGGHPRPGEISLAHHGVLFLDELPEYDRRVLEVLREPLEAGAITISRAARQAQFPARFQLVAAMNPCPCGYYGDNAGRCRCSPDQVRLYRARISGPLLDRIDLHIEVPPVPHALLMREHTPGESSAVVRERVIAARQRQLARQNDINQRLSGKLLERVCALRPTDAQLLETAVARLGLSARAFHRVLKVARTVADLAGSETIETAHLGEALQYRCLDRPLGRRA